MGKQETPDINFRYFLTRNKKIDYLNFNGQSKKYVEKSQD